MSVNNTELMKKAFSLIELLIVIVIVGVVYTLSVGNFNKIKERKQSLSLQGLKEYLQETPHQTGVRLLCLGDCSTCSVMVDGEKTQDIDDFLDKSVATYRYDFSYGMVKIENDYDVCFSYGVDKKGVGEQVFVEFKDKVYDFSTYLGSTTAYNSLEDAKDARESLIGEVLR